MFMLEGEGGILNEFTEGPMARDIIKSNLLEFLLLTDWSKVTVAEKRKQEFIFVPFSFQHLLEVECTKTN